MLLSGTCGHRPHRSSGAQQGRDPPSCPLHELPVLHGQVGGTPASSGCPPPPPGELGASKSPGGKCRHRGPRSTQGSRGPCGEEDLRARGRPTEAAAQTAAHSVTHRGPRAEPNHVPECEGPALSLSRPAYWKISPALMLRKTKTSLPREPGQHPSRPPTPPRAGQHPLHRRQFRAGSLVCKGCRRPELCQIGRAHV